MRAIGPVAGRGAPVPAVVVELVADVGHRQLVDDPALLRVDDGEEIWCFDTGPLVEAREIEELLRGRLHGLLRRGVEGCGSRVVTGHGAPFRSAATAR